ncbi:MAG: ribosomal protein S18-alanine N-acetyltransferase [Defluviitaleaceae bacterium]|nr:ribosomal protein S18-alanine N-acetyltransferase [Defluviitaleaceae bacterium]
MKFYIEPMEQRHIDRIYDIEMRSFSVPWGYDMLVSELDNPYSMGIVVYIADEIAGYATMRHIINEGHIGNIAVAPEHRGRGVGNALIEKLLQIAKDMNMIGITLEVGINNAAAQRLYTKNGFVFEGIRKNYYAGTGEDAIIMWKYLT